MSGLKARGGRPLALAAGIGALLALALASGGCATWSRADAPVTVLAVEEPRSFDPFATNHDGQLAVMHLVFSGLLKRDASGTLIPDLAAEVPSQSNGGVSRNGKTIRYRLRPGAVFSDGTPVTAEDVAATWRAQARDEAGRPAVRPWLDVVESVKASSPDIVEARLKHPAAWAVGEIGSFVMPKDRLVGDPANLALWESPVGSGPYRLVEWRRGDSMRFAINERYQGHRPAVRELTLRFLSEDRKQARYLSSSDPIVWEWLGPSDESTITRLRPAEVRKVWADHAWAFVFSGQDPLLQDARIRKALALAYPRKTVDSIYLMPLPRGTVVRLVRPDSPVLGPREAPRTDVEAAKRLLWLAGWRKRDAEGILVKGRRRLVIEVSMGNRQVYTSRFLERRGELLDEAFRNMEEAYARLGVQIKRRFNRPAYYEDLSDGGYLATRRWQMAFLALPSASDPLARWPFGAKDMPSTWNTLGRNVARIDDPLLDRLVAEAERPDVPAERRRRLDRVLDRLESTPHVIMVRPGEKAVAAHRVSGVRPSDGPWGDYWNVEEWKVIETP